MLWECPVNVCTLMVELLGGGSFEEFSTFDNFNKAGFIVGCEDWKR